MPTNDELKEARILIASVRAALKNGCYHFNRDGRLLENELEIIEAMARGEEVEIDESDRIEITTPEKELEKIYCLIH